MKLIRTLHPEVSVLDSASGIVEYIASDESLDSFREVIRADGWRFNSFEKNSPFVDSHDYSTIEKCLGKVIDFQIRGRQLVETVQWAIDVPENKLAQIGWKMTQAGYLKAVSVGFYPTRSLTPADGRDWSEQLRELGLAPATASTPRCIYVEQEQVELSCCIIGANPNALAKSYKAGVLTDADLDTLCSHTRAPAHPPIFPHQRERETVPPAFDPALAGWTSEQAQSQFLRNLERALNHSATLH